MKKRSDLASESWAGYYDRFKQKYIDILESRNALGKGLFAHHLHHVAIPDVTGTIPGIISWAGYSQPSTDSLLAFVEVFAELLTAEPHRIRNHRYFFLVPSGPAPSHTEVSKVLGELSSKLDYRVDSFSEILDLPSRVAVLDSLNLSMGVSTYLIPRATIRALATQSSGDQIKLISHIRKELPATDSEQLVLKKNLQDVWIDSTLILVAYTLGLAVEDAALLCQGSWGSALLAQYRATKSSWNEKAVVYCKNVSSLLPPKFFPYRIEIGDTLSGVVRRVFEMPFEAIWPWVQVLNPEIVDPNRIKAGVVIRIPILK